LANIRVGCWFGMGIKLARCKAVGNAPRVGKLLETSA